MYSEKNMTSIFGLFLKLNLSWVSAHEKAICTDLGLIFCVCVYVCVLAVEVPLSKGPESRLLIGSSSLVFMAQEVCSSFTAPI